MASQVEIANRALQRIGAKRINDLNEGSASADAIKAAWDAVVLRELSTNFWTFAITRARLSADTAAPLFGRRFQYSLPNNYLRLAPMDPTYGTPMTDFLFEGTKIVTDWAPPLEIRYVRSDLTPDLYHPLFANAIAMSLAMEVCEELTQSPSKNDRVEAAYTTFIAQARRSNGIEAGPIAPEIDELVAVRLTEANDATLRKYSN